MSISITFIDDEQKRLQEIDRVVSWIQETVTNAHQNGVVVGLSGGIDSAVVANLVKRAFPEDSIGVILPCKSSTKDSIDARAVAEKCGLHWIEMDLSVPHELIYDEIKIKLDRELNGRARITDANLRARLRMSTLYGVANSLGYLVAGTDNAAEVLTGYFTKYGDGGVDFLPLANLTKREVYEWAKVLGVPQQVIEREPSAGLWEGQTDEAEMGVKYDEIDDYLEGKAVSEAAKARIEQMFTVTEHKRVMPPKPPIAGGTETEAGTEAGTETA
jgi:NAD+ synthase